MTDIAMARTFRLADVFGKAFSIFGRRFVPFIVLTVLASIPNYIALLVMGTPTDRPDASFASGAGLLSLGFVTLALVNGAVLYGVIQELRGRSFSVGDSIGIALRRFLPMLGVAICTMLLIVLGWVLLFVPGIILACMWYVSMPVCIAERAGVFTSMSRSRFLTKGYRWQGFGTGLLILVVSVLLFIVDRIAGAVLTSQVGQVLSTQVPATILGSFNGVLIGVFYYELRVAKEGVDIDKIAGVFD